MSCRTPAAAMATAMETKIKADNGTTDYNAAFALSDTENPGAQARIFLTDGGHDVGTYNNGHLVHKVPTYVVGFSPGVGLPEDQARLLAIANETGGKFFPQTDSSQLQSIMDEIDAALTCAPAAAAVAGVGDVAMTLNGGHSPAAFDVALAMRTAVTAGSARTASTEGAT